MNPTSQFKGENTLGKILEDIRSQLFTSSRSRIEEFLKDNSKAPSGSTSALNSAFWKNI